MENFAGLWYSEGRRKKGLYEDEPMEQIFKTGFAGSGRRGPGSGRYGVSRICGYGVCEGGYAELQKRSVSGKQRLRDSEAGNEGGTDGK